MTNHQIARRVSLTLVTFLAVACLLVPAGAFAQKGDGPGAGAGGRLGVSASPDQFFFGGHYDTGYLFEHLSFRPNLEIGFGDSQTSVAANFEFAYWFPIPNQSYSVYVGAGPALNIFRYDVAGGGTNTSAKAGFNLLAGAQHRSGLFAELKLGFIDSPAVKFAVGYTWHR
jgi:hypothetical protein